MELKSRLEDQLKNAMREKDDVRKNALRMALSSIKLAEVEQRKALDEALIISILQKEIKTREETITEARHANRPEMIAPIEAEIQVLKEFLPAELSDSELRDLLEKIIDQTGASSIKEMGAVMKAAIAEVAGRASNDRVSKMIRELLPSP